MKIVHLEMWPVTMRLTEPYSIAYEKVDATTNVFLRVTTDKGLTGYGCAAPDAAVTGETGKSVLAVGRKVIEPALRGDSKRINLYQQTIFIP